MTNLLSNAIKYTPAGGAVRATLELEVDKDKVKTKLATNGDKLDKFAELAKLVFDQALLAEGGQLEDPAGFVHRLNRLMLDMSA